jgi:hypothetical protein
MRIALERSAASGDLDRDLEALRRDLDSLETQLNGDRSKATLSEPQAPTIGDRIGVADFARRLSTYGPTPTHQRSLEIAEQELEAVKGKARAIAEERLPALEKRLQAAGAPWTPGQGIP